MNGAGRPGDVISLVRYEDTETTGVGMHDVNGGGHTRNFPTLLQALEYMAALLTGPRCKECGGPIDHGWSKDFEEKIAKLGLCFDCVCWTENLEKDAEDNSIYVKGHRYSILPDVSKEEERAGTFVGHGGARFHIRYFDGREVISHNVWHQGELPACFKARRPDNAEFVRQ